MLHLESRRGGEQHRSEVAGSSGADRLLFGSDDPLIGDDTAVVDGLPLPAADKAKILGGNAARIFRLKQYA